MRMTTFGKIKSVAAVMMVFLLILATNMIDQDNFERVEASVEKIYEEQLMTKDAIIHLTNLIHEKEVAFLMKDSTYFDLKRPVSNKQIVALLADCEKGEVTRKEGVILSELKSNSEKLFQAEEVGAQLLGSNNSSYYERLNLIETEIHELAHLQLEEGRRQKMASRDAIESTKLFSRIEIYLLIILAVAVQIIILYPSKKREA